MRGTRPPLIWEAIKTSWGDGRREKASHSDNNREGSASSFTPWAITSAMGLVEALKYNCCCPCLGNGRALGIRSSLDIRVDVGWKWIYR